MCAYTNTCILHTFNAFAYKLFNSLYSFILFFLFLIRFFHPSFLPSFAFDFACTYACMCIWFSLDADDVWFIPITRCTSDPFGFKWLCNIFRSFNTHTHAHAHRTIPIQIIEWICIGTGTKLQLGLFNQI